MNDTILPHELPDALERGPSTTKILSLDCFDTLLWRDCHAPTDVFSGLETLATGQRIIGEKYARKAKAFARKSSEVSLKEIYAQAMPNASQAEIAFATKAEFDLEARACFAFAPTVQLMQAAKDRGLKVIIVSDTYLSADELEQLIERAAGKDVAGLIDRVFASSDAGISKSQGLLGQAIKSMKAAPVEVLHIGDNLKADYESARAIGIPALHLRQFSEQARSRQRLERACQQTIGDTQCGVRGLMPHRALLADQEPQSDDPALTLGLTVLGPVFFAFDRWLRGQARELEQKYAGKVHWLFMLRDGHLPHVVHQAGGEVEGIARVEISRFAAIAASLTDRDRYQQQVQLEADLNPSTLARQMLFDEPEIDALIGTPGDQSELADASRRLHKELRKGQRQKITRRRARARADRLIAHIRSAVDPQPGDTLMLVDLGYNGSAQNRIDHLLAQAFDVHVAGRYLLLREMTASGLDKKGLIDARHFDGELLEALCANVAVIEQLATCEMGSVVDFTEDGEPVRKASSVKGAQSAVRDRVQAGAVRFAIAASQDPPVLRNQSVHDERGWREAASGALTRFMFLPHASELAVLKSFEHDVNLGSERMVALFDQDYAREGLRRRGLFYMKGSERMFLPAELEREGMNTRLSLLMQNRFGLGISYSDLATRSIQFPVIYLGDGRESRAVIDAQATHDGYFALRLPVVSKAKGIAVVVGAAFDWLEIAGVTIASVKSLEGSGDDDADPAKAIWQIDGATLHAGGIVECTDPAATMLVLPPHQREESEPQMIEIIVRPLRSRSSDAGIETLKTDRKSLDQQQIKDAAA